MGPLSSVSSLSLPSLSSLSLSSHFLPSLPSLFPLSLPSLSLFPLSSVSSLYLPSLSSLSLSLPTFFRLFPLSSLSLFPLSLSSSAMQMRSLKKFFCSDVRHPSSGCQSCVCVPAGWLRHSLLWVVCRRQATGGRSFSSHASRPLAKG